MDPAGVTLDDLDGRHHDVLAALRADHPVAWVPALGGWVITSRALAVDAMRDAVTFTVDDPRFSTGQVVGPSMLSLDGPEHQRHRAPFADPLRPADATTRYGDRIRVLADELVQGLASRGQAELRRELAGPLAVAVSAMVLGIEHIPADRLLGVYDRIVAAVDGVARGEQVSADGRAAFDLLAGELTAAMRHPDTLVAQASTRLSVGETVSNAAVFLFGGIETSEGMTANVLHHLLRDGAAWQRVVAEPTLADAALEESLRLEPAAARVDRYATADVQVAGAHIGRGDLVIVSLAGANRDPSVFERPDEFDLDRPNARLHVTFAHGPHACLGAQLARLQARAAVQAVARTMPTMRLRDDPQVAGVVFRKPVALHATWPVRS
jgi:cytochrome P450